MAVVPPVNHPIWTQVIKGQREVATSKVALNMLLANVRRSYKLDASDTNMRRLIEIMHSFFQKYEELYHADLDRILVMSTHA